MIASILILLVGMIIISIKLNDTIDAHNRLRKDFEKFKDEVKS